MAVINYITRVQFDFGALRLLPEELDALGVTHPLVVTDKGLVRAGIAGRVTDLLGPETPVFDATPENPTEAAARAAADLFAGQRCDGIVGLGGGSPMDLAKAVAVLTRNPGPLEAHAYSAVGWHAQFSETAPLILVPTTAGTGSEVGRAAVIIYESGHKMPMFCPDAVGLAICDPELTLGLPPGLTAATGLDAVAHCLETFCAPDANPPADAIALDGLTRAGAYLRRAVADGQDREARWQMMAAAMEGALAFQKGLGAVHALSHPLGVFGAHHGTLNAILMPHVLAMNASHLAIDRMARMAVALGVAPKDAPAADVPQLLHDLAAELGVPLTLEEVGIPRDALAAVARAALEDSSHPTNPRPLTEADYRTLLDAAY